jgi:peptidoglycan hydrolase-like protein with peptidoglycan-binding domain
MSPRQTGALTAVFLALAAGTWVNALWLQTKPQRILAAKPAAQPPAPPRSVVPPVPDLVASPAVAETVVRVARATTDAAEVDRPPVPLPLPEAEPAVVRALQEELSRRGYGPLFATGKVGPQMRAAIMAFEYDQNLPLTGEASEALLRRLVSGAPPSPAIDPDARRVRSPEGERVVHTIQQSLSTLGFPPGRVDGRFGEETAAAIRAFEQDQGLPVTGRVSAVLFNRLAAVMGARAASLPR